MLTHQPAPFDEQRKPFHNQYVDYGVDLNPNQEVNSVKYKLDSNMINDMVITNEKYKELTADQQQNEINTGSSVLKLEKRSESYKIQQSQLDESQEYHSFLSDHENNEIPVENKEGDAKRTQEHFKDENIVEFETCNHDEISDSADVDEELQNRINEVIMVPNTTRHISTKAHMELKEIDAKNISNRYNLPDKTFKNPFILNFKKEDVLTLPILEGYLKKKSMNVISTWQNRYFVLEDKKLFYFKTKERGLITGCIDFDLLVVKIEVTNSGKTFKIIPEKAKRSFEMKAETKEEASKWIEAIEQHKKRSNAFKNNISNGLGIKKFWKHDRISPSDFLDQVDTGDLLLFKTRHPNAKLQRSFTGSSYDHVAILLKYQSGEIVLFEAASKNGVSLCRWKTFLMNDWKRLYSRIMYRKLVMRRKDDIIGHIEEFVKSTVGKKYKVNLTKLFKKKVNIGEEENKKDRTFFCSELVAAFYKKINILASDAAACGFLPGSFSSEKKIQLLNNARFDHEKLIDFSLEEDIVVKA